MRQVEVLNCVASTDELKVERDNLKAELADHKQQLQAIRRALDETRHSNSWKITAPLRKLGTFWRGAKTLSQTAAQIEQSRGGEKPADAARHAAGIGAAMLAASSAEAKHPEAQPQSSECPKKKKGKKKPQSSGSSPAPTSE